VIVTDEHARLTKSMTTSEVTKFWYDKFPWQEEDLAVVEQMVVSRVIELLGTENCIINGVKEFIEKLKEKDFKIGLATNSPTRIISTVLQKLNLAYLFDIVCSAESENNGKPDPAIYFTTARKLNIETNNCIAIEDSYSGMLAAKNAGMKVIAFTNGNPHIVFELADYTFDSFDLRNIEKLN
jgi:sugar-phosphatase